MYIVINDTVLVGIPNDHVGSVLQALNSAISVNKDWRSNAYTINESSPYPEIKIVNDGTKLPSGSESELVKEWRAKYESKDEAYWNLYRENSDLKKRLSNEPPPVVGVDTLNSEFM